MPFRCALVVLFCASVALAEPPELRPLKGEKVKGDLVEINDKEIVLQVNGKPLATPLEGVLALDFRAPSNPNGTYSQVELTDGSILRCPKVEFKKKDAILTLFSGDTVSVPMKLLVSVIHEANDVKLLASWHELLEGNKRTFDLIARKSEDGSFAYREGTCYDADEKGSTIDFKQKDATGAKPQELGKLIGLYFSRQPDPNMPGRRCEVIDLQGTRLYAKSVAFKGGKFVIETQCGASISYKSDALAKLDYNSGKLTYLSDIAFANVEVKQESRLGDKFTPDFKRDTNPEKSGLIRIAGKTYAKGLVMHSITTATFKIEGEYHEFHALAGIDDNFDQAGNFQDPVIIRIEGDGKELLKLQVSHKDGPKPINLNIKDVQKLRIIVDTPPENPFTTGGCVDLADARVSK